MQLDQLFAKLKFEHLPESLHGLCQEAAKRDLDYQAFLAEALSAEW